MKSTVPFNQKSQGFTLIEVIAAFTILAMTFAVILEVLSNSSRNTLKSSEQTQIAMLAQSKMDEVGIVFSVEESTHSGDFNDKVSWTINMAPYEAFYEGNVEMEFAPVELFKVDLIVSWTDGRGKLRETHFSTLRAMSPDFDRGPGG